MDQPTQPTTELTKSMHQGDTSVNQPVEKKKTNMQVLFIAIVVVLVVLIGAVFIFKYLGSNSTNTANSLSQTTQATNNDTSVLKVAIIEDENGAEANKKEFQPIVDYLAQNLTGEGITKGTVTVVQTPTEMTQLVKQKKADIVMDTAFTIYVVDKLANTTLIADRWKEGVEKYNSVFFTKNTSSIKSFDDLKGKIIAFDSPTSTTGYFLPKAFLVQKGYTLTEKKSFSDTVSPTEIGYVFVRPKSVQESVESGTAIAGAESGQEVTDYFGDKMSQYSVIGQTPYTPRFLVAVRSDLPLPLIKGIQQTLYTMDQTGKGELLLKDFSNTVKFTPLTEDNSSYGAISDLVDQVENEIVKQ